ncbi:aspartic peptidase domain-containing protein [Trichoderma evansii]
MILLSLPFIITLALTVLDVWLVEGSIVSVPLTRGQGVISHRNITSGSCRFVVLKEERNDLDFWFARFSIGASRNLSILVDTGSTDLMLNPNVYQASEAAVALSQPFSMRYGTVNSDGSGEETVNGTVFQDIVSLENTNLSVPFQSFGVTASVFPGSDPPFPHDGLMGFFVPGSAFGDGVPNWFSSLCAQESIFDECRFGLALKTSKDIGVLYLGGVERSCFTGELSAVAMHERFIFGDVVVGGKIIQPNATIMIDSGTTVSWGPIELVKEVFDAAGIQSIYRHNNDTLTTTLDGIYPCDTPPLFGFGFPSESDAFEARSAQSSAISHESSIFNIFPDALAEYSDGQGNCAASIHGIDHEEDSWILGQGFFQGRYIDHNIREHILGFADLLEEKIKII